MALTDKNIAFLNGTQASLDALTSFTEGTFYLTTDTHRLYIGQDNAAHLLSQAVVIVADSSQLPTGTNTANGQFYYVQGSNILCVYYGGQYIQINSNTYINGITKDVSTANGVVTITLKLTNNVGEEITLPITLQGSGATTVSSDASGNITVYTPIAELGLNNNSAHTISLANGDNTTSVTLAEGSNITMEDDLTNGVITINAKDTDLDSMSIENATNGGYIIKVKSTNNTEVNATLNPTVAITGADGTASNYTFQDGTMTLPVYSAEYIDDKLKALDAMEYQGTIDQSLLNNIMGSASDRTRVKIGDTYKVVSDTDLTVKDGGTARTSDLIIFKAASGYTEDEDGYLPLNGVDYDVISSGSAPDTTYTLASANGKIILYADGTQEVDSISVTTNSGLTSSIAEVNDSQTITINHAAAPTIATTTDTTDTTLNTQFTVLADVDVDDYGHLDSKTYKEVTLKNTALASGEGSVTADATTNKLDLTYAYTDTDGQTVSATNSLTVSSDTLKVEASASGNAGALSLNLVWGSF